MGRQPSVRSVAMAVGVSPATVSNAFNRPEKLSSGLRARVLAEAAAQGYSADPTARSLRTRRTGAIGVVLTVSQSYAFSDPYFTELLAGLAEVTEPAGCGVLLVPVGHCSPAAPPETVAAAVHAVERAGIDGALADGLDDGHPVVQALRQRGLPLVTSSPGLGRSVRVDDLATGRLVGEHLAGLGHRHVAVVVAHPDPPGTAHGDVVESELYPYSRQRLAGIRDGLGPDAQVVVVSGGRNAHASGRLAGGMALDARQRPTAIAADSDVLALGVVEALVDRGLAPGPDVAVTGFDDLPAAARADLTTIRQPIREKGRLMGRMLLEPDSLDGQVVLPAELVVRGSTAGARR